MLSLVTTTMTSFSLKLTILMLLQIPLNNQSIHLMFSSKTRQKMHLSRDVLLFQAPIYPPTFLTHSKLHIPMQPPNTTMLPKENYQLN